MDPTKYSIFRDIPGHEAPAGGTIPHEVSITNQPLETNIEEMNLLKILKNLLWKSHR